MKLFFLSTLFFIFSAFAGEDAFLDYKIAGSLGPKAESLEKFEMDFDRQFVWFSNETGGLEDPACMSNVGEFRGTVTEAEKDLLVQKAMDAVKSIPPATPGNPPVKGIMKRLKLIVGDKSFSANLSADGELTKEWNEMETLLRELSQKLAPKKLMNMSAQLLNPKLMQVRYHYWGKQPFVLILPNDPALAFRLPGYRLEYASKPAMELQQLGPSRKNLDVTLKLIPLDKPTIVKNLYYSNKQAMHHANMNFVKGHLRPDSANICSVVKIK